MTSDEVGSPLGMVLSCGDEKSSQLTQCDIGYAYKLLDDIRLEVPSATAVELHTASLSQLSLLSLRQLNLHRNVLFRHTPTLQEIPLNTTDVSDDPVLLWDSPSAACVVLVTPSQVSLLQSAMIKKVKNVLSVLTLKLLKLPPSYVLEHAALVSSQIVLTAREIIKVVMYHEMSGLHVVASISLHSEIRDISCAMVNNTCYIGTLFWAAESPQFLKYTSGTKDIELMSISPSYDVVDMTLFVVEDDLVIAYASNTYIHFGCLSTNSSMSEYSLHLPSQVHCIYSISNSGNAIVVCAGGAYFVEITVNMLENRLSVNYHKILLPHSLDIQVTPLKSECYLISIARQEQVNEMSVLSLCCGIIDASCPHTIIKRSRLLQQPIDKLVKCNDYIIVLYYDTCLQQSRIEIFDTQLICLWTSEVMQSSVAPCCVAGPMNEVYSHLNASHGTFTISLSTSGGSHVITFVRNANADWKIVNVFPIVGRVSGLYSASTSAVVVVYDHFLQILHCCEGRKVEFRLGTPTPLVIDDKV